MTNNWAAWGQGVHEKLKITLIVACAHLFALLLHRYTFIYDLGVMKIVE